MHNPTMTTIESHNDRLWWQKMLPLQATKNALYVCDAVLRRQLVLSEYPCTNSTTCKVIGFNAGNGHVLVSRNLFNEVHRGCQGWCILFVVGKILCLLKTTLHNSSCRRWHAWRSITYIEPIFVACSISQWKHFCYQLRSSGDSIVKAGLRACLRCKQPKPLWKVWCPFRKRTLWS